MRIIYLAHNVRHRKLYGLNLASATSPFIKWMPIYYFEIPRQSSGERGECLQAGPSSNTEGGPDCRPNEAGRACRTYGNCRSGSGNARGAAVAGLMGPYSRHRDGRVGRPPEGRCSPVVCRVGRFVGRRCRMTAWCACGSYRASGPMSGVGVCVEEAME